VPLWQAGLAALTLAAITALAVWQARRRPYLIVGWLWFVIGLVPALGLMQSGWQAMADRFTYIPHIGLAIGVVWGAAEILQSRPTAAAAIALMAALLLTAATSRQLPFWHDSVAVFRRAVAVTGPNPAAHHYLAVGLDSRGQFEEGLAHHAESVRLKPDYGVALFAYGVALERRGETEAALRLLRQSAKYFPTDAQVQHHIALNQNLLDSHQR
jgi:tetratricopeptide (TPR) repeat protein